MPPLSILIWIPATAGLLGTLAGATGARRSGGAGRAAGAISLLGAVAALALAIGYIADYTPHTRGLQHVTDQTWIAELGIHYKLGIDGLNIGLVGLTALLYAAAVLAANLRSWERPRLFYFLFMLSESAV